DDAIDARGTHGVIDDIRYNERGQTESIEHSDGSSLVADYDDLTRTTQRAIVKPGGDLLQGWDYTYDRIGNLTAIDDLDGIGPDFSNAVSYDAWYRATDVEYGTGDSKETVSSAFDLIDNITARTSSLGADSMAHMGAFAYHSDKPNALSSAGDISLGYDAAGYVNSRNDQQMTWDYQGRLTEVTRNDETLMKLTYGPGPNRVAKQEGDSTIYYISDDYEIRDGIATLYPRLGMRRVARVESDALATTVLTDLVADDQINAADAYQALVNPQEGTSSHGALLMSSVRRLHVDVGPADGVTHLYHDYLGSITLATVDGEAVGQRSFYDTGLERETEGYVDEYGFTGQGIDRSTGLLFFKWRIYDPALARWMSIDPLFFRSNPGNFSDVSQSTTAYAYVSNNFLNNYDPTGLEGPKSGSKSKNKSKVKTKAKGKKTKTAGKTTGVEGSASIEKGNYKASAEGGVGLKVEKGKTHVAADLARVGGKVGHKNLELRGNGSALGGEANLTGGVGVHLVSGSAEVVGGGAHHKFGAGVDGSLGLELKSPVTYKQTKTKDLENTTIRHEVGANILGTGVHVVKEFVRTRSDISMVPQPSSSSRSLDSISSTSTKSLPPAAPVGRARANAMGEASLSKLVDSIHFDSSRSISSTGSE
ncbi:MAG: RHS repeat-associated core domain-containing protein, partial [Myxococcota bacterium]